MKNTIRIKNVISEWEDQGGVLGYTPGSDELYLMNDEEFENRFSEYAAGKTDIQPEGLDKDGFAELLCESALRNVGICEEEIGYLMAWDADKMEAAMMA